MSWEKTAICSAHAALTTLPLAPGERLTRGWVPLLRLLAAVPERGDPEAIKLGFQSVQLMCSDYMASLPTEQLRRCLEIAAMYANQQVGMSALQLHSCAVPPFDLSNIWQASCSAMIH